MNAPANLFPGLSDISDVLEEYPIETSRYLTLLHEIDAKCVHSLPQLDEQIKSFVKFTKRYSSIGSKKTLQSDDKLENLVNINKLFEELIPSLEEKMYVSSIMLKSLEDLTKRLELAYEVALKNQEIPEKLRLGVDNHPAMHLHHELMLKIENTKNTNAHKSAQSSKSESRREAMAASKKQLETKDKETTKEKNINSANTNISNTATTSASTASTGTAGRKRANNTTNTDSKKRKTNSKDNRDSEKIAAKNELPKPKVNEYGEPLYCYCNRVAFGEMVGCDGANCELEWFHLPCIGLTTLPRGKWYCNDCKKTKKH